MSLPRVVYRGTVELLEARVKVIRPADAVLDTQAVYMALDDQAFVEAQWEGDPARTRICSAPVADLGLPDGRGQVEVYVRITDSPEAPILRAGTLFIRDRGDRV